MSNRTAKASRAISKAWENEKELVLHGKGTRDWTKKQQEDIIKYGKAYDEDGKAFEGHHMMNVEKYPQFQEEAGNIQFLTRVEHKAAHNGNFQNPTLGYYDYKNEVTKIFTTNTFEPCEIIILSNPIVDINISTANKHNNNLNNKKGGSLDNKNIISSVDKNVEGFEKIKIVAGDAFCKIIDFSTKHPIVTSIVTSIGWFFAKEAAKNILNDRHLSSEKISNNKTILTNSNTSLSNNETSTTTEIINDISENDYTPNDVPAGGQHYHYKDGSIKWKEKEAYHRG